MSGYEPVDVKYTSNHRGGLESGYKNGLNDPKALLDGSTFALKYGCVHSCALTCTSVSIYAGVNSNEWYYAIGSENAWNEGIRGASSAESQVELWVKQRGDGFFHYEFAWL